jgi:LmbE family N-acetylglucosaminyl deacetylase
MRPAIAALLALLYGLFCGPLSGQRADNPVVLVVSADTGNYLLAAGGTIASMIDKGAVAYVIRVTNDDKDAWELSPEEAALRTRSESEQAGQILGVKEVISMGYRAAELADVPFTTLRDRLMIYIRHYRPTVMFVPNPYTEYDRVLDRYYTGRAAEDAWRAAAFENYLPPFGAAGLKPHLTPELYYYAQPLDPRRRETESTSTFVPEPRTLDISATFARKLKAVQALKTINYSTAMRLNARLTATGRKLPLLNVVNEASVNKLVEENVRGLAKVAASATSYSLAEEFRYAGVNYRIPAKYLK